MVIEDIKKFFNSKFNKTLAIGTIIVSFSASLGDINGAIEIISSWLPNKDIAVVQARLEPFLIINGRENEQDDVFLMISIRNYSMSPIMIVSADIEGKGSYLIRQGKAGRQGLCTLSSNENSNEPLMIYPGKTIWVKVGNSTHISGLSDTMSKIDLQRVHLFESDSMIGIHEVYFVDVLNDLLIKKYGRSAEIVANLYVGREKIKHSFSFNITQGKDLFSKDGSLQHDWFLAQWIKPKNSSQYEMDDNCEVRL